MGITDPIELAARVGRALGRARDPYGVCGGVALAAWGRVRDTKDADLATLDVSGTTAQLYARSMRLGSQLAFEAMRFGGLEITRTTVWDPTRSDEVNMIDWIRPRSLRYAREALRRAVSVRVGRRPLRLLSPEDFVLFKVLSTRDLDTEDAASVLVRNEGRLDLQLIASCVRSLARAIPDHDVRGRWEAVRQRAARAWRSTGIGGAGGRRS